MKMNAERVMVLIEHWAGCAIFFGLGYWMLSYLKSGAALLIALAVIMLGAFTKLVTHSRLKRLYAETPSSGSSSAS